MRDEYDFATMKARPNPYLRPWQVWIEGEFAGAFPVRGVALAEALLGARSRSAEAVVVNVVARLAFRVAPDGTCSPDSPSG